MLLPQHLVNTSKKGRTDFCVDWCVKNVNKEIEDKEICYTTWKNAFNKEDFTKEYFIDVFDNMSKYKNMLKEIPIGLSPLDYVPTCIGIYTTEVENDVVRKHTGLDFNKLKVDTIYGDNPPPYNIGSKETVSDYNILMDIISLLPNCNMSTLEGGFRIIDNNLHVNILVETDIGSLIRCNIDPDYIKYFAIATSILERTNVDYTIGTDKVNITIPSNSNIILDVFDSPIGSFAITKSSIFTTEQLIELDKGSAIYTDIHNMFL